MANWIAPGAAEYDALQTVLQQRAVQQRQQMMDKLAADQRATENTRAAAQLKLQQDQETRVAAEQAAQEKRASEAAAANRFRMGDVLPADSGVNTALQTPGASRVSGTPAVFAAAPTTVQGPEGAPPMEFPGAEGQAATPVTPAMPATFKGLPAERASQEQEDKNTLFAKALRSTPNMTREQAAAAAFEANIKPADADGIINAVMGPKPDKVTKPQSVQEFEFNNAELVAAGKKPLTYKEYQDEDANRKRSVTNINAGGGMDMSPDAMAGDVEDILTGRNSTMNLRQTMGRTNAAAGYMQRLRAAVKKADPEFDFALSDAGTKAVSSNYFQRSVSAINAVLPNIDDVARLSSDIDRIGVVGIDRILQKGQMQFGNVAVTSLHQARKMLADEVGLALGQGTVSDMKLQLGFDITDPAVSDENFVKNMAEVKKFVMNRKAGLNQLRYHSTTRPGSEATGDATAPAAGATKRIMYDMNGDPVK